MTKRKHQLLTESERDQILAIPSERDHLARLYTFEPSDIEIIGARRERRNQLGVALQLALLRHPGITLAQLIQDKGAIPHDLAAFVAEQLDLHVTDLANYAARDQTMTDHARELAMRAGLLACLDHLVGGDERRDGRVVVALYGIVEDEVAALGELGVDEAADRAAVGLNAKTAETKAARIVVAVRCTPMRFRRCIRIGEG